MSEQTCPSCGVPYVDHDGLIRTCAKLQSSPLWYDRPTGPGLWVSDNRNEMIGVSPEHCQSWGDAEVLIFGRVYGPIPADEGK